MTILVVEDHPALQAYMGAQLEMDFPDCRVLWAASVTAALAHARDAEVDIVILDLALPDGDGLELILPLRACGREPAVIVFTARDDESTRARAVAAPGFAGLLWKGADSGREISAAVRTVAAGGRYITKRFWREGDPLLTASPPPGLDPTPAVLATPSFAPTAQSEGRDQRILVQRVNSTDSMVAICNNNLS